MASEGKRTREDSGTADPAPPADAYPRLRHIEITNYKALDHLVLDIPTPTMPGDPDIFVVGSKNGLGKTSLLECCALAQLNHRDQRRVGAMFHYISDFQGRAFELARERRAPFNIEALHGQDGHSSLDWLWQAVPAPESSEPKIRLYELARELGKDNKDTERLARDLGIEVRGVMSTLEAGQAEMIRRHLGKSNFELLGDDADFTQRLFGQSPNILLQTDLLFFHAYRKVAEGTVRVQEMLSGDRPSGASVVKLKTIRLLLGSSGLVEGIEAADAERRLDQLNTLLTTFTGGRIDKKLRPIANDQLDLRIVTPRGTTFSFDGLSSGQKEIVTTLFLIWNETLAHPALVLIDEPELHLNAEWQREFLRHLLALAPQNQYILATHSEDIFASVSEERRVLLEASHG
jgi:hypothetical protein